MTPPVDACDRPAQPLRPVEGRLRIAAARIEPHRGLAPDDLSTREIVIGEGTSPQHLGVAQFASETEVHFWGQGDNSVCRWCWSTMSLTRSPALLMRRASSGNPSC